MIVNCSVERFIRIRGSSLKGHRWTYDVREDCEAVLLKVQVP